MKEMKRHGGMMQRRRFGIAVVCLLLSAILLPPAGAMAAAKEKIDVAMILFRGESQAEQGFRETLQKSERYDVTFTVLDAEHNPQKLNRIVREIDPARYRLIYTFGTLATLSAMKHIHDTPIVFNIVQRPVEAGIVRSWDGPGNRVTGASNFVSMGSAFRTLRLILHIHKLGFLFYRNDPATQVQKKDIEGQEKVFGFRKIDFPVDSKEAIPLTLKRVIDAKVDAVMIPADAFLTAFAADIIGTLNRHKIPTVVVIPEMVKNNGALIALGADYYTLGRMAAENALEILAGKKPDELPVRTVDTLNIVVNLKTADRLGINFPMQLLKFSEVVR